MLQIRYELTENRKAKPDWDKLGFGKYFTDHMFVMDYDKGQGWHDARVIPYQNLSLDPACMVFHYAQEMFEGLKAYRTPDNEIQLFRPDTLILTGDFIHNTPEFTEAFKDEFGKDLRHSDINIVTLADTQSAMKGAALIATERVLDSTEIY